MMTRNPRGGRPRGPSAARRRALMQMLDEKPQTPPVRRRGDTLAAAVVRDLIFASGGVSDAEARLLLRVLDQLEMIERRDGEAAVREAARGLLDAWLQDGPPRDDGEFN